MRTSILAGLAALREYRLKHGKSAKESQAADVLTACVLDALSTTAQPDPTDDGDEQPQREAA